ncbi:MAG: hypothetical protein NTV21_05220 [Planctomycetota bacterium]|nr:hypothetical protein [Planctomycetota bacterium]
MPLQKSLARQLALTVLAASGVWVFVGVGGAGAALPGIGLAWLGWQSEARNRGWLRAFRPKGLRLTSEALGAACFFGVVAAVGIASGGGLGCGLSAIAFCVLSIALEALDVEGPAVPWGIALLAWVGPALPTADRAFSVSTTSVDDWLPVLGLTAIYAPLAALLLWRGRRP